MSARWGVAGAVLVALGLSMVGAGSVLLAFAENQEVNCEFGTNCESAVQAAENLTVAAQATTGAGYILAGIGGALLGSAVVRVLSRPAEPAIGSPPPSLPGVPHGGATGPGSDTSWSFNPPPPYRPPGG
jgi:hypothetical protein